MSRVDMSAAAVTARLRAMSRTSNLDPAHRLATKVDMSEAAVTRRLRLVSRLRQVCMLWQRVGEANGLGQGRRR